MNLINPLLTVSLTNLLSWFDVVCSPLTGTNIRNEGNGCPSKQVKMCLILLGFRVFERCFLQFLVNDRLVYRCLPPFKGIELCRTCLYGFNINGMTTCCFKNEKMLFASFQSVRYWLISF